MRNRFRPNVTPRGSRSSEPSSSSSSSSTSVSEPVEPQTEEEPTVFIPPNSSRVEVNLEFTELNSSLVEDVEVTSTPLESRNSTLKAITVETTSCTRRARIKPSITPVARTRNKPANRGSKIASQENNDVFIDSIKEVVPDAGEVVSSDIDVGKNVDTPPPKDINTGNTEQQPNPASKTPELITQVETPIQTSKQVESSASTGEGNPGSSGSLLSRRKRTIPNIGAAARRRSSVSSLNKDGSSDKGTNPTESSVCQQAEEIHDKNISESKETEERNKKNHGTTAEVFDNSIGMVEVTVQGDKDNQVQIEDEEELEQTTIIRKTEERKRKSSRYLRLKEPLDPSKMTLQDLIYFNPKCNPMKSSLQSKRRRIEDKGQASRSTGSENGDGSTMEMDDQEPTDQLNTTTEQQSAEDSLATEPEDRVCAPQVKIGADGCIILDEESDIVYEDATNLNYAAYFKQTRRTRWSMPETLKFYQALSQVGTDFSLMLPLFPKRKRRELKAKFKREDKYHRDLVDKVLVHHTPITIEMFARHEETEEDVLNEIMSGNDKNSNNTR